jgi:hypothetical protein
MAASLRADDATPPRNGTAAVQLFIIDRLGLIKTYQMDFSTGSAQPPRRFSLVAREAAVATFPRTFLLFRISPFCLL